MSDELLKLAERCEAATGPDYALDFDIAHAVQWAPVGCSYNDACTHWYGKDRAFGLPAYSASLDAAMTLVPEGCFWTAMNAKDGKDGPIVGAGLAIVAAPDDLNAREPSEAATPALALCAAALRAAQEMGKVTDAAKKSMREWMIENGETPCRSCPHDFPMPATHMAHPKLKDGTNSVEGWPVCAEHTQWAMVAGWFPLDEIGATK